MRVGVSVLCWTHDVRMGINPEHCQVIAIALAGISGRRQIDVAVPTQGYNRFRCMPVDGRAGGNKLFEQGVTRDDAAIDGPLVQFDGGNPDGLLRSLRIGAIAASTCPPMR